jgi:hypothetical protein
VLPNKPGATSDDIESALNYILTGVLDIASGVSVKIKDSTVIVEISGAKMTFENVWYYQCLGSPLASIAATISSDALGKPVRILEETNGKGKSKITMEVLSG